MKKNQSPSLFVSLLVVLALAFPIKIGAWIAPVNTYTVTNTNNSGPGSLRQALLDANAHEGPDLIIFAIPPADPNCVGLCTISPTSALPALLTDGTTINGYTQPGAAPAHGTTPAVLYIQIDGTAAGVANGFTILSAQNTITGLAINRFAVNGIYIGGTGNDANMIQGNHIGTSPGGTLDWGNGYSGVFIAAGASGNTIGGDDAAERNVLSGNGWNGVDILGAGSDGNVVSGNYIGMGATGLESLPNDNFGVRIHGGAQDNLVGGDAAGERNLISGNEMEGVRIVGTGSDHNTISGNYIGTNLTGSSAHGNGDGVFIAGGAQNNTVGGDAPGESNLISGNEYCGVVITGTNTMSNTVSYNLIGTDANGVNPLGNETFGVLIYGGASHNTIGGDSASERNIITSSLEGIRIEDAATGYNVVSGNYIGADASGIASLGNLYEGIKIEEGAHHTRIGGLNASPGGACSGECNLISGNGSFGVYLFREGTSESVISGNYIGTDVNGTLPLPNQGGISMYEGVQQTTIGGSTAGERNLISGNTDDGIYFEDAETIDNLISGNYIGTDVTGSTDLGNGGDGIEIHRAISNTVGGSLPGEGNLISCNDGNGILLSRSWSDDTSSTISGNIIGLDASASAQLGNGANGILVDYCSGVFIGGQSDLEANLIAGNQASGISIDNAAHDNRVWGNRIGAGTDLDIDLGNAGSGISISGESHHIDVDYGNLVLYNASGVTLFGEHTNHNVISDTHILHSDFHGVLIAAGASNNDIGDNNVIRDNFAFGVYVTDAATTGNWINRNSISSNGVGIKLEGGAHNNIAAPVITGVSMSDGYMYISGQTTPDDWVEIFGNSDEDGEGEVYIDFVYSDDSGAFVLEANPIAYPYLTATTSGGDGTSEFSSPFANPYSVIFLPMVSR